MQFPPQNFINNQINPALAKMTLPQANISDGNISLSSNQTNENNLTRNARFEVQESANIANPAATNFISYNTDNQNLRAEEVPIEIAKKLVNLSPELLHQLISQTKMLLKTDPDQARQILIDYPHLAYALLQSLIISGLIDSTEAIKMIRNTQGADTVSPIGVDRFKGSQNLQTIPSSGHSNHFNKPQDIDFNQSSKKFHMNIPQEQSISQTTIPARIDPVKMNEKNDTFSQNIDNEKAELIRQVMNLTDEQIRLLPAEQRESVIQLKSQVFGQQFF
ncbi:MAG: Cleavage stimulation factor subunit 2 [Marteilia pararefringens]